MHRLTDQGSCCPSLLELELQVCTVTPGFLHGFLGIEFQILILVPASILPTIPSSQTRFTTVMSDMELMVLLDSKLQNRAVCLDHCARQAGQMALSNWGFPKWQESWVKESEVKNVDCQVICLCTGKDLCFPQDT